MRWVAGITFSSLLASTGQAQSLEDLRAQVRESVSSSRMTAFLAGITDLSESRDLSSGRMTIDGTPDLDLTIYALPYRKNLDVGSDLFEFQLEAGVGYLEARSELADLWNGSISGGETKIRTRWRGLSGYFGGGPRFALGRGFHLTPLANASISYLENRTYYEGPGAAVAASLLDGILFNWHATNSIWGLGLRGEHEAKLAETLRLTTILRYDVRRFEGIRSSDPAQDASDTLQRVIARTELSGPTAFRVHDKPIEWAAHLGYSRFLDDDGDTLGFVDYFEIGGRLTFPLASTPVPLQSATLSGALMFGDGFSGFSVGGSVAF